MIKIKQHHIKIKYEKYKKQISRKNKAKSGISISRNKYETRLVKDYKIQKQWIA